jgi:digeranylgeranylglycerophospholipid reductase
LIIGADGCESKVGRWAGITDSLGPHDAFSSVQYRMKSDFCNDGFLHFFLGSRVIPKGYIWIFPKTREHVLAGAGLYGWLPDAERASAVLDRFIEKNMPGSTIEQRITGCVPLAICPQPLFRENVVLIGDAARQANPLTAGGIMNSLEAADCLASELLGHGFEKQYRRPLMAYCRKWSKQRFNQKVFSVVKEIYLTLTDKQIARLVGKARKTAVGRINSNPFFFTIPLLIRLFALLAPAACRYYLRRMRVTF